MGTNFYWDAALRTALREPITLPTGQEWTPRIDTDDPTIWIGKRSADGMYCWDCNKRLLYRWDGTWSRCLGCDKTIETVSPSQTAAWVELGFGKPRTKRPTGIASCSSFTWGQDQTAVRGACERYQRRRIVQDEYGKRYTGRQFLAMLAANCPIQRPIH